MNKKEIENIDEKVILDSVSIFKALGDETRLQIMSTIFINPKTVSEIIKATNVSQSCVSHQLKFLKELRLVKSERKGKCIFYSFEDDHIKSIISQTFDHVIEE